LQGRCALCHRPHRHGGGLSAHGQCARRPECGCSHRQGRAHRFSRKRRKHTARGRGARPMTLITYDTLSPGTLLGEWEETLDPSLSCSWTRLFGTAPADESARQAGLAVVLMIRAYLNVVTPRPPGNVHAKQVFTLENLPEPGKTVRSRIGCVGKEIRRE